MEEDTVDLQIDTVNNKLLHKSDTSVYKAKLLSEAAHTVATHLSPRRPGPSVFYNL